MLQIVYALYKMLLLKEPRGVICKHEQLTLSVLELVVDSNAMIRDFSNMVRSATRPMTTASRDHCDGHT